MYLEIILSYSVLFNWQKPWLLWQHQVQFNTTGPWIMEAVNTPWTATWNAKEELPVYLFIEQPNKTAIWFHAAHCAISFIGNVKTVGIFA